MNVNFRVGHVGPRSGNLALALQGRKRERDSDQQIKKRREDHAPPDPKKDTSRAKGTIKREIGKRSLPV